MGQCGENRWRNSKAVFICPSSFSLPKMITRPEGEISASSFVASKLILNYRLSGSVQFIGRIKRILPALHSDFT